MTSYILTTVGTLGSSPLKSLYDEYEKRIHGDVQLKEIISKKSGNAIHLDECSQILSFIDPAAFTFALDEKGKTFSSIEFAQKLQNLMNEGQNKFQFIIGGADGLNDEIRDKSNFLLSFGRQTWPHKLARIMLMEQIYRSQQINAGHPYHRE